MLTISTHIFQIKKKQSMSVSVNYAAITFSLLHQDIVFQLGHLKNLVLKLYHLSSDSYKTSDRFRYVKQGF